MRIAVSRDGPYLVSGGVTLITEKICNDDEGHCRKWREVPRLRCRTSMPCAGAVIRRTSRSATGAT